MVHNIFSLHLWRWQQMHEDVQCCCFKGVSLTRIGQVWLCLHAGLVSSACLLQRRGWIYWRHMCPHLICRGLTASIGNKCIDWEATMCFRGTLLTACKNSVFCFGFWFHPIFELHGIKFFSQYEFTHVRLSVWTSNISICKWFCCLCEINCFLAYRYVHMCFIHSLSKISFRTDH